MDTKYVDQALREFGQRLGSVCTIGDLTLGELSRILQRAQQLKDADHQRSAVLDRMGA